MSSLDCLLKKHEHGYTSSKEYTKIDKLAYVNVEEHLETHDIEHKKKSNRKSKSKSKKYWKVRSEWD